MTRSAILIFVGLMIVGCTRTTPAPVIYGQPLSQARTPPAAAPVIHGQRLSQPVIHRTTYAVAEAVPLPETKPRSLRSLRPTAPVTHVSRTRTVPKSTRAGTMAAVRPGDTIHSLARRYSVSVRDLIDENRLSPPFRLIIGQRLMIPASHRHVVAARETVYSIAQRYGVDMRALVRSNGLTHPFHLRIGQVLWVPGTVPAKPRRPAATFASIAKQIQAAAPQQPRQTARRAATTKVASIAPTAVPPQKQAPRPAVRKPKPVPSPLTARGSGARFAWPTRGRVISRYGAKRGGLHNDGINIAVAKGAPVRAAADGVVAYAGNELRGFGNLVLVRHPGGWTTAYAHNDAVLVKRGDSVRRGDLLARAGSSGSVKRTQVHFEIRRGTEAVDPLRYLAQGGKNRTS